MEYCEGGDVGTLLKKCKKESDYIAEDVIWKIFTQIVLALYECHKHKGGKILHRDLKPANIFLDGQNNIKLGDFGLSRIMGEQSMFAYTHVGTPYYMSPEQINESKYNEKSDIWSAGCLLYEISALKPPFEAKNHLSLALKIKTGKFDRLPIRYSEDLQKLIEAMLYINPDKRPDVDQLLQIPQVAIRKKEKKLRDKHALIKQKEDDIKKKEESLKALEQSQTKKEDELKALEMKLMEYDKSVKKLESDNNAHNISLTSFAQNISLTSFAQNTSLTSFADENVMPTGNKKLIKRTISENWKERGNLNNYSVESDNVSGKKIYSGIPLNMKAQALSGRYGGVEMNLKTNSSSTNKLLKDITNLLEKN